MTTNDRLKGLRVLLTGSTGGIGQAVLGSLVAEGATVIAHARDSRALDDVTARLAGSRVEKRIADLSSIAEAARLADEVAEGGIDVVIHNAGVGFGSDRKRRETSRDGFELRFAINYLAPFVITERLVARGLPSRAVIDVASGGQAPPDFDDLMFEKNYDGVLAYCRSKLAMVMDAFERARRDRGRSYMALHPGTYLDTKMVHEAGVTPLGTAASGAEVILAVTKRALAGESGLYFDCESEAKAEPGGYDVAAQERLRERALTMIAPIVGDIKNG